MKKSKEEAVMGSGDNCDVWWGSPRCCWGFFDRSIKQDSPTCKTNLFKMSKIFKVGFRLRLRERETTNTKTHEYKYVLYFIMIGEIKCRRPSLSLKSHPELNQDSLLCS